MVIINTTSNFIYFLFLSFSCSDLLVRLLCQLCFNSRLKTEISRMEKPNRNLQGVQITGKVKYLGMERRGGAQTKSFHSSPPDEDFYSCQNTSQGFGEWVPAGDGLRYTHQRGWLQYPCVRPSSSPLLLERESLNFKPELRYSFFI